MNQRSQKTFLQMLAMLLIVGILAIVSFERNAMWRSDVLIWEDAVNKNHEKLKSLSWLCLSYFGAGNFPRALECYNRAAAKSNDPLVLMNRGVLYIALGLFDRAAEDLTVAIDLFKGDNPEAYYNRGIAYDKMGRLSDALSDFDTAISLSTRPNIDYHMYRGKVYEKLGRYEDARKEYMLLLNGMSK